MSQAQLLPTGDFSPTVSLLNGKPATTSLAIAEHFGKQHKDVLKSIRNLWAEVPENLRERNFAPTFRTVAGPNNSERQEEFFIVYFDGFILLVMGYTGKKALQVKLAYIAAFNAMRDELAAQREAALPHVPHIRITPSTPASRKPLRSLVNAWARLSGQHQDTLWPQVKAHFQLERIDDLPEEWIPDAITWVQSKIDALPKALPAAELDYALAPAQAKFVPGDLSVFEKEVETTINSMTYLVNRMELSGHPSGLTWGQISRNKPLYEAITENIQSARAACVAGLRMLKSVKLICTGVR